MVQKRAQGGGGGWGVGALGDFADLLPVFEGGQHVRLPCLLSCRPCRFRKGLLYEMKRFCSQGEYFFL